MREYIVYACPTGALADQIDTYYDVTRSALGPNTAHQYMPHCTLTGFFHDLPESIPIYVEALAAALERARSTQPQPELAILKMELQPQWHGLVLDGPWLKKLTADFASAAASPTRRDALRLKDWLHVSLAYGFPAEQHAALAQFARELVDISAPVGWDLRLYERLPDGAWVCHSSWELEMRKQ